MTPDQHFDDPAVRHEFPHPIAVLYDLLRSPHDAPRLSAALALAEGVARYLAWTLLADAAARGSSRAELAKYARARGFGGYLHAIAHLVGARPAAERLYPELDALLRSPWWTSLDRLRALRNDAAHGRVDLHAGAAALFLRYRADVIAVVDGCAFLHSYPIGLMSDVRIGADGRPTGTWRSCRGTTPRGVMATLPDASGIPSDQLLLVDVARGVALPLAPFLCLIEEEFVWLDLPAAGDERRSPYLSPVPGRPLKSGVPNGLFDPGGAHPDGIPLDDWLDAPRQWPRYAMIPAGSGALPLIVGASKATMAGLPARGREPAIDPLSSQTSLPPIVTAPYLPGRTRRHEVNRVGVLLIVLVIITTTLFVRDRLSASSARVPSPPVPTSAPVQIGLAPVASWAPLAAWLREWDAVIRSPQLDEASMRSVYADFVRFRGSTGVERRHPWIIDYWRALFGRNHGSFTIDWSRSQWRLEPLSEAMAAHADACAQLPGAEEGVVLARLAAIENDPNRYLRARDDLPCARLDGVYLLRMRPVPGRGMLICYEGWSRADGICAPGSCPQAPVCQRLDR
ncbi:MAG: hypothetical protein JWM10_3092 [Myxococcaceae bacterium]|nr:hypothetical protein [Myxococcaceae bacterium]